MSKINKMVTAETKSELQHVYAFYSLDEIHRHSHDDADTIDLNHRVNPTVCGNFSSPGLPKAFKDHKYSEINFEAIGVPYLPWEIDSYNSYGGSLLPQTEESQSAAKNILSLLEEGGVVVERISKSDLENTKKVFRKKGIEITDDQIQKATRMELFYFL